MNAARPSLVRSIPFWALVLLSLAGIGVGGWTTLSQIGSMNAALAAGTATPVQVYGAQSLAITSSIVLGAGIVGLLLALAVASARALVPVAPVAVVAPVEVDEVAVVEPTEAEVIEAAPVASGADESPVSPEPAHAGR